MELEFVKLNGLGNDFVFVDNLSDDIELNTDQVRFICDRHFGIGADGVILVSPSPRSECCAYMHYINSDGTLAQMCGNGVRCFAKYLVDRGFVDKAESSFVADTLAGPKPIRFEVDENGFMIVATVNMGKPIFDPLLIPVEAPAHGTAPHGEHFVQDIPIDSPWGPMRFTVLSMGNPHAVCFIDDVNQMPDELFVPEAPKSLDSFDINSIGAFYESNPIFSEKTNVEFAIVENDGIRMRVFERGCGETLACGTGACATSVAATLTQRAGYSNVIRLRGGDLSIEWTHDGEVMMTGPARESFQGKITV